MSRAQSPGIALSWRSLSRLLGGSCAGNETTSGGLAAVTCAAFNAPVAPAATRSPAPRARRLPAAVAACDEIPKPDGGTTFAGATVAPTESKAASAPEATHEEQSARQFGDQTVRCTLRWRTPGIGAALDLTAHLVGEEGLYVGRVDDRLARCAPAIDAQFRGCGVQHLGSWEACPEFREDSLELNIAMLTERSPIRFVFLHVGFRDGIGSASGIDDVTLKVTTLDGSDHLVSNRLAAARGGAPLLGVPGGGVIAALLVQGSGGCWLAAPARVACGPPALREDRLQDTMMALVAEARAQLSKYQAAASALPRSPAVATLSTDELSPIRVGGRRLSPLMPQHADSAGVQQSASQPLAPSKAARWLSFSDPAAAPPACAPRSLQSPLGAAAEGPHFPAQPLGAERTLGGLHEPSTEAGYMAVVELRDELAMKAFLQRAVEEAGGAAEDCSELAALAALHSREGCPALFAAFWEELTTCAWATLPHRRCSTEPAEGSLCSEGAVADHSRPLLSGAVASAPQRRCAGDELPLEPKSGSTLGGARLQWVGDCPAPLDIFVDGRPCAALHGGAFVVPMTRTESDGQPLVTDVVAVAENGQETLYESAFTYWRPGEIFGLDPPRGALVGGQEVRVKTSDLGAPICVVKVAGMICDVSGSTSNSEAIVNVPPSDKEELVTVEVEASNGNSAVLDFGFRYFQPEAFGLVGDHVALSEDNRAATRTDGINKGVLLGAFPAKRSLRGRYFEICVDDVCRSIRTLAVGFTACRPGEVKVRNGFVHAAEARELDRVWLAGYDKGGAIFLSDGQESKIPPAAWRPVQHVKAGSRIGVLWLEALDEAGEIPAPALCIFQDGEERVRLPATGRLPQWHEELFALVDLQGTAKGVTLLEGALPPIEPLRPEDEGDL